MISMVFQVSLKPIHWFQSGMDIPGGRCEDVSMFDFQGMYIYLEDHPTAIVILVVLVFVSFFRLAYPTLK